MLMHTVTNQTILKSDFAPNPVKIMEYLAKNTACGVKFGFIHGSYVYKEEPFIFGAYKETMYFEGGKFIKSVFSLKQQPPDVDIVTVVSDIGSFMQKFNEFAAKESLKTELNYFLTINAMEESLFNKDIFSEEPTALKRILKFRKLKVFGDASHLEKLKIESDKYVNDTDYIVQFEYDQRKEYLKDHLLRRLPEIILTAKEYEQLFPAYCSYVIKSQTAGFPEKREKIVLPHSMDLKAKVDVKTGLENSLR